MSRRRCVSVASATAAVILALALMPATNAGFSDSKVGYTNVTFDMPDQVDPDEELDNLMEEVADESAE